MQPGRAQTSGLGVPPLLLARWVGWVAPVRPTHGVLVLSCPSAALRVHVCAVSWATWVLFTGVPAWCVALLVRCPGPLGFCSPLCPLGALLCVCGVPGHLAPVHRCACSVCCLCVRRPGPLGSCSPVCPLGALFCLCGVLGHLAPVHRCARLACCVACVVSWATWLLFTGLHAQCIALRVRRPGPLGSCSPVCPLGVLPVCAVSWATWLLFTGVPARRVVLRVWCPGRLGSCPPVCPLGVRCCVCDVPGYLAPVHRCACSVRCSACAVSWATWLLFTGVPARCVPLLVRCPGPLGSCSPVCPLGVLSVCAVSWATWLLFTGVPAQCVVLLVRCPGPLGSCSPVCPLGVLFCLCGVLGHLAPVQRCARWVCCFACAVSWATWLLFTSVPARCVACVCGVLGHLAPVHRCARSVRCLCVRYPGPLGSCSPVCPLGVLFCLCGVLGHLAPVHRCARLVCCVARVVSWAPWLLFPGALARCAVRCPGPLGSCSAVCPLGVLFCLCGVLGHLAPVHRCARAVCCLACAVSWATWLLFTGVPARCVASVCSILGHLAPVHRCVRLVRCFACAVSWATWLLFTGVPARCVVLRVRCPGPLGSCSPVCPLGVLCCACGVLGPLALVHRCARPVCCAVSWATWLLFTCLLARCVVLLVACAGRRCGVLTRPSGRWPFVAGRGCIPTGRALVHPDSGCSVAGRGWVPSGRTGVHPDGGCSVAGRGWVCCRARTRPSGRRLVLLGTCPCAVVRCVLCALSGFAAPGGRCGLAPAPVPWLWPAACLSGVPRGPACCAAPRPVRSLSVLRSAFPTPWCLSQTRGLAPPA